MVKLIVNADDFGYSKLINKKILELIEEKYITSTSIMVDSIESDQKEQVSKLLSLYKDKNISLGLHVDFKNTNFREEIERQFRKFVEIFGFEPHYLDIHKSTHLDKGFIEIQKFCKKKHLPCKNLSQYKEGIMIEGVITTKDRTLSATKESFEEIKRWVNKLNDNIHLINFHPGYYDPDSKSSFNEIREVDAEKIVKLREIILEKDIELVNFNDLRKGN